MAVGTVTLADLGYEKVPGRWTTKPNLPNLYVFQAGDGYWYAAKPIAPAPNTTGTSVSAGSAWDSVSGTNAPGSFDQAAADAVAAAREAERQQAAAAEAERKRLAEIERQRFKGRVDAVREMELLNQYARLNEIPARANIQRNRAATGTQAGLLDAGYFDQVGLSSQEAPSTAKKMAFVDRTEMMADPNNPSDPTEKPVTVRSAQESDYAAGEAKPEGNVTYKLKFGADGRLYRQAYVRAADAFASRGVYSSSLVNDTNKGNRLSLDTSRDQAIRNYNDQVNTIASNQANDTTSLNAAITQGNLGYAKWTGEQDVILPSAPAANTPSAPDPSANTTVAPPPQTVTPSSVPRGSWTVKAAGANAIPRLTRLVAARYQTTKFKIVRRGNRYVVVSTK